MPRRCTICDHPERQAIDQALINKEGYRSISNRFQQSIQALTRHNKNHIPLLLAKAEKIQEQKAIAVAEVAQAKEAIERGQASSLLDQVNELIQKTDGIYEKAEKAGDLRTALAAIRESRGNLELLGKLIGELQDGVTVNIHNSPEWIELRTLILVTLESYPTAKEALINALAGTTK